MLLTYVPKMDSPHAHPGSARPLADLGVVLAKQGRLREAADAWRAALGLDPRQPQVAAWLAAAERQLDRR